MGEFLRGILEWTWKTNWKRTTSTFDIGTENSHIWKEIHFHKPSFWVSTLVFGSATTYLSLFPLPSDSVKGVSQGAPLEIYQSYGSVRGNSALNLQGTNISLTKAFLMMICLFLTRNMLGKHHLNTSISNITLKSLKRYPNLSFQQFKLKKNCSFRYQKLEGFLVTWFSANLCGVGKLPFTNWIYTAYPRDIRSYLLRWTVFGLVCFYTEPQAIGVRCSPGCHLGYIVRWGFEVPLDSHC